MSQPGLWIAIGLWLVVIILAKFLQYRLFPDYSKSAEKLSGSKDPGGFKLIRKHPYHTLGWYGCALGTFILMMVLLV